MSDKTTLYIDTDRPNAPRFRSSGSFFCVEYQTPGPTAARMLAAQQMADRIHAVAMNLTTTRLAQEQATSIMGDLWHEIEEIVRRFVGASAATTPSEKDSEAPTSVPSEDNSSLLGSSSSTRRKATQSTSKQAAATPAPTAKA